MEIYLAESVRKDLFPSIKYLFSMLYRLTNGLTSAKIIIATKILNDIDTYYDEKVVFSNKV